MAIPGKRELETQDDEGPAPSLGFRTRLRAAVAEQLRARHAPRPLMWWEPLLAFGSAFAVVIAAMVSTWGTTSAW